MARYLFDTNAFITSKNNNYPFDVAPGFWNSIQEGIEDGSIIILDVVRDEIYNHEDDLTQWMKGIPDIEFYTIKDDEVVRNYGLVLQYVHTCGLFTGTALRTWAAREVADAWLIAVAMKENIPIITFENSKSILTPKSPKTNIKIPDVASYFGVEVQTVVYYLRESGITLN